MLLLPAAFAASCAALAFSMIEAKPRFGFAAELADVAAAGADALGIGLPGITFAFKVSLACPGLAVPRYGAFVLGEARGAFEGALFSPDGRTGTFTSTRTVFAGGAVICSSGFLFTPAATLLFATGRVVPFAVFGTLEPFVGRC